MAEICKYYGKCGGCTSQHIPYKTQLINKKNLLASLLKIKNSEIDLFSANEFNYRNRMDFVFHEKGLGFREKDTPNQILDIDQCIIAEQQINSLLIELRDFFKEVDHFDFKTYKGTFKYAVIRTPKSDSSISFVLNSDSFRIEQAIKKIKHFSKNTTAKKVLVAYTPSNSELSISKEILVIKGSKFLKENILNKNFVYSSQGFFQNNSKLLEEMHSYCNSLLKQYPTQEAHLLDLYGGVGTFGIINSNLFKQVFTVENNTECTESAELNTKNNNCKNIKAITLDAAKINKLNLEKIKPLFVILDPPRSGMHQKTINHLKSSFKDKFDTSW